AGRRQRDRPGGRRAVRLKRRPVLPRWNYTIYPGRQAFTGRGGQKESDTKAGAALRGNESAGGYRVDVTSARSADSRMMDTLPKGYPKLGETPEISARTASHREELCLDVTCRLSMTSQGIWPSASPPFRPNLPRRTRASRFVDSRDAPGIRPFLENGD